MRTFIALFLLGMAINLTVTYHWAHSDGIPTWMLVVALFFCIIQDVKEILKRV